MRTFARMKMFAATLLVAFCLFLSAAWAANPSTLIVGGEDISVGGYWMTSGGELTACTPYDSWNVHYDGNGTLSLSRATIVGTVSSTNVYGAGIYADGDLTIAFNDIDNEVLGAPGLDTSAGIYLSSGSLTVRGDGCLRVQGDNTSETKIANQSYGIYVKDGNLTAAANQLEASSGKSGSSMGICVGGGLSLTSGASVKAESGQAGFNSYAVQANGSGIDAIVLSGAAVFVTAEAAGANSTGLNAPNGNIVIESGVTWATGKAVAGEADNTGSYGIYAGGKVSITGGTVEAKAGKSSPTSKGSYGIYAGDSISIVEDITSVTATSDDEDANAMAMNKAPAFTDLIDVNASSASAGTPTAEYKAADIATYKYLKLARSSFDLAQAVVTVSESNVTYDGTEQKPAVSVMVGETPIDPGIHGYSLTFSNNVDAGEATVTVTPASTSEGKSSYCTNLATGSFIISKLEVRIADVTVDGKIYDGTNLAAVSGVSFASATGGSPSLNYSVVSAEFDNANAGGGKTVTVKIKLSEDAEKNYSLKNDTYELAERVISPASLRLQAVEVEDKTYDGAASATVGSVQFNGLVGQEAFVEGRDYAVVASFRDANAGKNKDVDVEVTLLNANYQFGSSSQPSNKTSAAASAGIAKAPLVWDASGLSAARNLDEPAGEVAASGALKLLDIHGNVLYERQAIANDGVPQIMTSGFVGCKQVGSYQVEVVPVNPADWGFSPAELTNYLWPTDNPTITARVLEGSVGNEGDGGPGAPDGAAPGSSEGGSKAEVISRAGDASPVVPFILACACAAGIAVFASFMRQRRA